ncbi:MAG: hypothetical protein L0956_09945 [Candidatus Mariimomonas ferrooxydans]
MVEVVWSFWGSGEIQVNIQTGAPHETRLLHLNCDKAYHILGWHPRWDFDRAVDETAYWYKEVLSGKPTLQISRQQIKKYMETEND